MAEGFSRDRLQPALFDRLIDDEPDSPSEPTEQRLVSKQKLRQSVLRDLNWLLNAQADLSAETGLSAERVGLAAGSVLNFGLPPLSGKLVSKLELTDLEHMLHEALVRFEPRILAESVSIRATTSAVPNEHHNCISFEISGQLWAQPHPLELLLKTDLDLETGLVDVRDNGPKGGSRPAASADPA